MTTVADLNTRTGAADPGDALRTGMAAWRSLAVELPVTLLTESMRFAGTRLQAQAEHMKALGRCATMDEALKLQSSFVAKAVSDYHDEAATVSRDLQDSLARKAA